VAKVQVPAKTNLRVRDFVPKSGGKQEKINRFLKSKKRETIISLEMPKQF
jgi:hypothetical protein